MRLRPAISLSLAASLSLGGGMTPAAHAAPGMSRLEIKVGQANGFSRIEFHGAQPSSIRRDGKDLVLSFAPLAPPDLSRLRVDPPKWLKTAALTSVRGGAELRLKLAADAKVRLGRADGAAFVNISPGPLTPAPTTGPTAAPPPSNQIPSGRPDPVPVSGAVKMTAELSGRTLLLRFPWRAPLGAAVFRRGETVWVVFDAKAALDISEAPHGMPQMRRMDLASGKDFTAVRIVAPPGVLVTAGAEGGLWTVALGPDMSPTQAAVQIVRDEQSGPVTLKAEVAGATGVFWIDDPVVGDRLAVVPALAPSKGLAAQQAFVDATFLPSAQGLALQPVADDLKVETDGDLVRVSRAASGLALSPARPGQPPRATEPPLDLPRPAAMPGLIRFDDWSRTGARGFLARYDQILDAAAEEMGRGKRAGLQARLALARFLVGSELSFEAIGVLDNAVRADQTLATNAEFRGLRGAARAMAGRYKDAQADFSSPAVAADPACSLWRSYVAAKLGDYTGARQQYFAGRTALSAFTPKWRTRFARQQMEAALAAGDLGAARSFLLLASSERQEPLDAAALQLDRARLLEAGGQTDPALALYDEVAKNPYGALAAPALLHATRIRLGQGRLAPSAAVSTLASLRYMWRGDATELETIRALGQIYLGQGRYREALEALRSAGKNLPDMPAAIAVQADLGGAFRGLFLEGRADGLQPIQALALFYDFRELTPIGADGDMMVRKLAHRLVDVDLLDQAAELLKYQAENRLDGVPRAEVATDLAMIDLMAKRPEEALSALNESRSTLLPNAMQARRRVIEARAWTDLSRYDHALEILGTDNSADAMDARAEVAWRQHDWSKAGPLLEGRLGDRWRQPGALSPNEEGKLLRAGIAYSLGADQAGLARLRARYGKLAQVARSPDALRVALSGEPAGGVNVIDYAKVASDADSFSGWVSEMKKRYLAGSPPAAPTPARTAQAAAAAAKRG